MPFEDSVHQPRGAVPRDDPFGVGVGGLPKRSGPGHPSNAPPGRCGGGAMPLDEPFGLGVGRPCSGLPGRGGPDHPSNPPPGRRGVRLDWLRRDLTSLVYPGRSLGVDIGERAAEQCAGLLTAGEEAVPALIIKGLLG